MCCLVFVVVIFLFIYSVYVVEDIMLVMVCVNVDGLLCIDSIVVVQNCQVQNWMFGILFEYVFGVQSSVFGLNVGVLVICSLSGNWVQILEDGQFIFGLNVLSGDINIFFDLLFVCSVMVNKLLDIVCYGGNVLGGSVNIDFGLIFWMMEDQDQVMELVL